MKFADSGHFKYFQKLIKGTRARRDKKDWLAALFLLSAPLLAGKRTEEYVGCGMIRFAELKQKMKPWSSSEKAFVKLAAALFNSSWKADINDIFWSLDADNVNLALEALKIRFSHD